MEKLGRDDIAAMRDELEQLYRRSFAEPPWHETEDDIQNYLGRLATQHDRYPDLSGLAERDGELVGIVYGWPAEPTFPDNPFHQELAAALPPEDHHLLLAPALEVAELMVDPAHRGRGIGRRLLVEYCEGWDSAWLCTHPDAPARRLYESAGWQHLIDFTSDRGDPRVVYTLRR